MEDTKRVMVVEDNARARQALTAYMSLQDGIKVTAEASNGLEAISTLRENTPDIILMDARMPAMDGLEATRIIKKNWPQIKVIVLTLYPEYEPDALRAGADAFLLKGCLANEMMSTINCLLQPDEESDLCPDRDGEPASEAPSTFCVAPPSTG